MKYLITDKKYNSSDFPDYTILGSKNSLNRIKDFILNNSLIGFDIETTGLDAWENHALLYCLGNKYTKFVFDHYHCDKAILKEIFNYILDLNVRLLGHNIKFDINFVRAKEDVRIRNVYDTMIAEQRLWQKLNLRMGLANLNARYFNVDPDDMDKTIRIEFIGADPEYFKLERRHCEYVIGDISPLFEIKEKQDKDMYEKGLYNLIYKIENPLINVVSNAEITGFDFNIEKWRDIYLANIEKQFEVECKLDDEFRRLRDNANLTETELLRCKGGKYDNKRVKSPLFEHFNYDGSPKATDLFGNPSTVKAVTGKKSKVDFYPNNIKYTDTQILEIFAHLKETIMTKFGQYEQPIFKKNGKLDKDGYSFTTNVESLNAVLIDYPNGSINEFIKLILQYRKLKTRINNFGVNYESKLNTVTGKLHTEFRQCRAVTGRFQSGGGRNQPKKPNFQNIPADYEMRSCFEAPEGYSIITADYAGAELIVMCSLSQDMDLLEMSKRDMHSEISTLCWKAVFRHRVKYYEDLLARGTAIYTVQRLKQKIADNIHLSSTFFIDKSPEKKHLRTGFKPVTFGVIYGLRYKNLAVELGITDDEAKIIIKVIENKFPKVFRFVRACAKFAERNGYLVLNNRTKSRVYFPNIIKELKGEISRDVFFKEIMEDINEARNIAIQGTQADAIKEASVALDKYIKKVGIDCDILSWVHDEFVIKIKNEDLWKPYTITKGEHTKTFEDFGKVVKYIMCDTFNNYLNNVTINVDYTIEKHWVKD